MKEIMVTLGERYVSKMNQVLTLLSADGLIIGQVYPFGVIKGSANDQVISKLRNHKEVEEVKEAKTITVAPPDSAVQ